MTMFLFASSVFVQASTYVFECVRLCVYYCVGLIMLVCGAYACPVQACM